MPRQESSSASTRAIAVAKIVRKYLTAFRITSVATARAKPFHWAVFDAIEAGMAEHTLRVSNTIPDNNMTNGTAQLIIFSYRYGPWFHFILQSSDRFPVRSYYFRKDAN